MQENFAAKRSNYVMVHWNSNSELHIFILSTYKT